MILTRALSFLSFAVCCLAASGGDKEFQYVFPTRIRCNISDKFVYPNVTCFPKAYSRTICTLNVHAVTKEPLNPFVEFTLFFKYGTIYRDVMHSTKISVCKMVEKKFENLIMNYLYKFVKDVIPDLPDECPFNGLDINNTTAKLDSIPSILARGDYRIIFVLTQPNYEHVATIEAMFRIISSNRDTFG